MVLRDELNNYLIDFYTTETFNDYCENGLQVEGKEKIKKILFAVSFNLPLLQRAITQKVDAIIVHHGIFAQGNFKLKGPLKQKVKDLLDHEISLFGIHLPMDAHPKMGHSALLLDALGAENIEPFDLGVKGDNRKKHSFNSMLEIFHQYLHPQDFPVEVAKELSPVFHMISQYGFTFLNNGPEIPAKVAIVTGGASNRYEEAVKQGIDTFFAGDIKEQTPAFSLETQTNFANLGHYFSEKPGILALQKHLENTFDIETIYIEVENPV